MNKKHIKYLVLIILLLIVIPVVHAETTIDYDNICSGNILSAMKILGYLVFIAKIVVPFIIIVLGMMDYARAVVSDDENAINKSTKALLRRLVAGFLIFFSPAIVLGVIGVVSPQDAKDANKGGKFYSCTACVLSVSKCDELIDKQINEKVEEVKSGTDKNSNIRQNTKEIEKYDV